MLNGSDSFEMEEEVTFQVNESVIIEDKGLFYEGRVKERIGRWVVDIGREERKILCSL